MDKRKSNEIDMLHGSLYSKMLMFIVPMLLSNALQLLFNATDVIVVGRYVGGDALAAVGATSSTVSLIVNFFTGFTTGINYVVARDYVGTSRDKVVNDVHTSIAFSLVFGLALCLFGIYASRGIMRLISTPENIIDSATLYLRIYFIGLPAIALYNAGASIVRSKGDTRRPMIYLILAGILNVILNLFFVIVMKMGVEGVAIATSVSNCLSCTLMTLSLLKEPEETGLRLHIDKLRIRKKNLLEIMDTGVPCAVQSSMFGISNILIQSAINSLGTVCIAASAAASNIENFVYIIPSVCSSALMTFMSQNVGARKYSRIDLVFKSACVLGFIMTFAAGIILAVFGGKLLTLYSSEPDIIAMGKYRLMFLGPLMWMEVFMDGFSNALKGLNKSRESMIISVCCICGFRVIWLNTVFKVFETYTVVLLSWPVSWLLISVIYAVYYKKVRSRFPKEDVVLG